MIDSYFEQTSRILNLKQTNDKGVLGVTDAIDLFFLILTRNTTVFESCFANAYELRLAFFNRMWNLDLWWQYHMNLIIRLGQNISEPTHQISSFVTVGCVPTDCSECCQW